MGEPASSPEPGDSADSVVERLTALEARVEHLESGLQAAAADSTTDGTSGDQSAGHDKDVFWALDGLRSRAGPDGGVLMTGTVGLPTGERAEWQEAFATDALLEGDWSLSADALAALGHPLRLLLLRHVCRGVRTAAELGEVEGLGTTGQLYHHLRQLVAAGWLRTAGRGRYEIPAPKIVPLLVIVGGTQP